MTNSFRVLFVILTVVSGLGLGLAISEGGAPLLFALAIVMIGAVALPSPSFVVVFLLVGFLLGDRLFAFLSVDVRWVGIPLFVTEASIAAVVALMFLKYVKPSTSMWRRNAAVVRTPALVFLVIDGGERFAIEAVGPGAGLGFDVLLGERSVAGQRWVREEPTNIFEARDDPRVEGRAPMQGVVLAHQSELRERIANIRLVDDQRFYLRHNNPPVFH